MLSNGKCEFEFVVTVYHMLLNKPFPAFGGQRAFLFNKHTGFG